MRNLTLSLIVLGVCFTVFTSVPAQAEWTLFDFNDVLGINGTDSDTAISRYMTGVMGSTVIADDVEVRDNWDSDNPIWAGKAGADDFLRCDSATGDLELIFSDPISRVTGDGYAFYTQNGYDYHIRGYDASYGGDHENPLSSSLVTEYSIYTGSGHDAPFDVVFDRPVSLLVLSNGGREWIGVDNLSVQTTPVPGAGLLAVIGMGVTGWLKRRKTL